VYKEIEKKRVVTSVSLMYYQLFISNGTASYIFVRTVLTVIILTKHNMYPQTIKCKAHVQYLQMCTVL